MYAHERIPGAISIKFSEFMGSFMYYKMLQFGQIRFRSFVVMGV